MLRIIWAIIYFAVLTGYAESGPKPRSQPCSFTKYNCHLPKNIRVEFDAPAYVCTKLNPRGKKNTRVWFERNRCTADFEQADWYGQQRCSFEERL